MKKLNIKNPVLRGLAGAGIVALFTAGIMTAVFETDCRLALTTHFGVLEAGFAGILIILIAHNGYRLSNRIFNNSATQPAKK